MFNGNLFVENKQYLQKKYDLKRIKHMDLATEQLG